MTRTIYKWQLARPSTGDFTLQLAVSSKLLAVGTQIIEGLDVPVMWTECPQGVRSITRTFRAFMTGAEIPPGYEWCFTHQEEDTDGSPFVWHLYEKVARDRYGIRRPPAQVMGRTY